MILYRDEGKWMVFMFVRSNQGLRLVVISGDFVNIVGVRSFNRFNNCLDMGKTENNNKQEKHRELVLTEFRKRLQDILEPHHDDQFLQKWLIARDYDIIKAEKMIRESFVFRKKIGADTILTHFELPEVFKQNQVTAFLGYDKENSAIRLFMIGLCDYKGYIQSLNFADIMRLFVYSFEYDIKKMEDKKKEGQTTDMKTIFVFDYNGFAFKKFYHKDIIKKSIQLLNMFQDNYPETLKVAYLINVPSYFTYLFNIFKPFMSAATLSKIKIYGTEGYVDQLRSLMDPRQLPAFIGGDLTDPDGNPKCTHLVNWANSKVDPSFYLADNSDSMEDSSLKTVTVQKRAVLEIPVEVPSSPVILRWVFTCKEYNIRFGLFLRRGGKSATLEEVIPVKNLDCHILREENEFLCKKTGTYILHFDNSYSWLTAKQISYKVELENLTPTDSDSEFILV